MYKYICVVFFTAISRRLRNSNENEVLGFPEYIAVGRIAFRNGTYSSGFSDLYEGRTEMFYLTTHSTHFIYDYMASDMVKDHSDSEKGNPLPPHKLLFPISSKGSFICTIPQTG